MRTTLNKEQYYALQLWDATKLGITPFEKTYIGTEKEILEIAKDMEKEKKYPDTVIAIKKYFAGDKTATHLIAFEKVPVLTPIIVKTERVLSLDRYEWVHKNDWALAENLKCDGVEASQIIVKYQGKYLRCIRARFKNLQYEFEEGVFFGIERMRDNNFVYNFTATDDDTFLKSKLYAEEIIYDKYKDAKADFESMDLRFFEMCNDVFGNG